MSTHEIESQASRGRPAGRRVPEDVRQQDLDQVAFLLAGRICRAWRCPNGTNPAATKATKATRKLVLYRELRGDRDGKWTHDRRVGVCTLDGTDIAAPSVCRELARDCARFSGGRYWWARWNSNPEPAD